MSDEEGETISKRDLIEQRSQLSDMLAHPGWAFVEGLWREQLALADREIEIFLDRPLDSQDQILRFEFVKGCRKQLKDFFEMPKRAIDNLTTTIDALPDLQETTDARPDTGPDADRDPGSSTDSGNLLAP